jgi:hypothetical protein
MGDISDRERSGTSTIRVGIAHADATESYIAARARGAHSHHDLAPPRHRRSRRRRPLSLCRHDRGHPRFAARSGTSTIRGHVRGGTFGDIHDSARSGTSTIRHDRGHPRCTIGDIHDRAATIGRHDRRRTIGDIHDSRSARLGGTIGDIHDSRSARSGHDRVHDRGHPRFTTIGGHDRGHPRFTTVGDIHDSRRNRSR